MPKFDVNGPELTVVTGNGNTVMDSQTEGVAGAGVTATLAGAANLTTYITGFQVTSQIPAAAKGGSVTVSGLKGGKTLTFQYIESTTYGGELIVQFANPLPGNGQNSAITVTLSAIGSGALSTVTAQGFQQA